MLHNLILYFYFYKDVFRRNKKIKLYYATYNNKNAIIRANKPVASAKAKPKIA